MAEGPVPYTDKGGGGELPPHGEDFFDRIIGVHWRKKKRAVGGTLSFVGYIDLTEVVPRGPGLLNDTVYHATWLGGTLLDGNWVGNQSESGLGLFCCVRGEDATGQFITVAAGWVVVGPFDYGPGYSIGYDSEPAAGVSSDNGATWGDAGIPVQKHTITPPNPITGTAAEIVNGNCNAVAYHPDTQTFYVGGTVNFLMNSGWYHEDRMYSLPGGGLVYSERREFGTPFTGYRWPAVPGGPDYKPEDRLRVADRTGTTPSGKDVRFVVSLHESQQVEYAKGNEIAYVSKGSVSPPMAAVNAVTAGGGLIVAVGWRDEDRLVGPVTFVSEDDGLTWTEQLSALTHTNPGPESPHSGSSSGSCSFS